MTAAEVVSTLELLGPVGYAAAVTAGAVGFFAGLRWVVRQDRALRGCESCGTTSGPWFWLDELRGGQGPLCGSCLDDAWAAEAVDR